MSKPKVTAPHGPCPTPQKGWYQDKRGQMTATWAVGSPIAGEPILDTAKGVSCSEALFGGGWGRRPTFIRTRGEMRNCLMLTSQGRLPWAPHKPLLLSCSRRIDLVWPGNASSQLQTVAIAVHLRTNSTYPWYWKRRVTRKDCTTLVIWDMTQTREPPPNAKESPWKFSLLHVDSRMTQLKTAPKQTKWDWLWVDTCRGWMVDTRGFMILFPPLLCLKNVQHIDQWDQLKKCLIMMMHDVSDMSFSVKKIFFN